jgi:hypothetical protein
VGDWPSAGSIQQIVTITPNSEESCGQCSIVAPDTATFTSNVAYFIPFRLRQPIIVFKLFIQIGSVGATSGVDLGIYDRAGTRIVSTGLVTVSANSIYQNDIADTFIGPGQFYLAVWTNSTPSIARSAFGGSFSLMQRALGMFQQASLGSGLPANASFSGYSNTQVPLPGLIGRTLV